VISARRIGAVVRHELRVSARDPLPLMVLVVFPVVTMAFLKPAFQPALAAAGHPDANGAEQVVPGQAVLAAFFVVTLVTWAFFSEHGWGTWDRVRASPASSFEIVAGKGLPRVALGVAQLLVVLVAGVVLFDLHIRGDALALVPLAVVFPLCLVVLGVAATAVFRTAQQAQAFGIVGMVVFGAVGGALVPVNVLPGWARTIAPATPTYWAMRGFRSVVLDGRSFGGVALPVGVLSAMTVAFTVLALARLRLDEAKVAWA
jgi:ABC-2 type transport system permease protein